MATRHRRQAKNLLGTFLERLRNFTVLDPACGSGNFLYLGLHALHDLEHRVQLEAEAMGLERAFPSVGPANVKGIELNAYAAELARVSVWIGEIQWMRRNGFPGSREPVLDPLETIECRDAILTAEGGEPEWPEADVIIGNPPFLGGKLLISNLGEEYVSTLFGVYEGRVPREADLVCYWFVKAGEHRGGGASKRVGLVATNSIRGGANRRALERATDGRPIFDAWSDEPWVIDEAAVRVSLVCFSQSDDELTPERRLDGETVDDIYTDLTARRGGAGVDLTKARRLARNAGVAFMGDTKGGPFDVPGDLAREWLRGPANPNGQLNSDVLAPWMNGMAITRCPADKWIVDFGWTMEKEEAALYEAPFQHAQEHVYPMRQRNRIEEHRLHWWRHLRSRQDMWTAAGAVHRYAVCLQASTLRMARCAYLSRSRADCHRPRGRHHFRDPAQPLPRDLVAPHGHLARQGQRSALHPHHDLRDFPFSGGTLTRRARQRPPHGSARAGHRFGNPAARRATRPLAQPARVGGMGRGARPRLSSTPGTA